MYAMTELNRAGDAIGAEEDLGMLPILVLDAEADGDAKAIFQPDGDVVMRLIPVETLRLNLYRVCRQVSAAVKGLKQVGDLPLKTVTIQVEVSAEGGVELIGTAKLGGKGAITLTFGE
jgi:hypothetical protein